MVAVVLVVALAALLSSPDVPPVTIATWAKVAPADFVATAASELAGTSETATYGPPYNSGNGSTQRILFSPETIVGVRHPINAAQTFVLSPLEKVAPTDPALAAGARALQRRPAATQSSWNNAYSKAVTKVTFHGGTAVVPPAADGPIPVLISTELTLARSGALDADLIANQRLLRHQFHQAAAVPRRRPVLLHCGHSRPPERRPVGRHERDRQLPGPALAVALHPVVPGARV